VQVRLFQVDAFAGQVFQGNPAAVCPLHSWLDDSRLQAIAEENNLSETAFLVRNVKGFDLRWFTPRCEVGLCGHATLAAAFVVFNELNWEARSLVFESRSGTLEVKRDGDLFAMDFPALKMVPCDAPSALLSGLSSPPQAVFRVDADQNYFAIYASEAEVKAIRPNLPQLEQLHPYGVAVSARGDNCDCVSRYFAPGYGIPEDPVTGSIHCALVPYWAERMNKRNIHARQISNRAGELLCDVCDNRVQICGRAVKYLEGSIFL